MGKNPHAVALGRMKSAKKAAASRVNGLTGGAARAAALTPKRRAEIARKAAEARWGKK